MFFKLTLLSILIVDILLLNCSYSQQTVKILRQKSALPSYENFENHTCGKYYVGASVEFERGYSAGPNYVIGPEIPISGLTGYYDWQTNGMCPHYLAYVSENIVHAIYMTSFDSIDISSSRRTRYSFSSDGGYNWTSLGEVPNIRSGFPSLTFGCTGNSIYTAIIGNHYQPGIQLTSAIHVDLLPGVGVFISTGWNYNLTNFIWPEIATFTNGNILVGAETDQMGAATDTGLIQIFNPNTCTWIGNPTLLVSPATDQINMRWVTATGPYGKGIYVLDPIADMGGPYYGNRIFYWTTTDNGQTWTGPTLLWESQYDSAWVFHTAWLGLDAVYDTSGNFYVAFNTLGDSLCHSSIWVSKNGLPAVRVAKNEQIPGAAWYLTFTLQNACTMDWPSLSVSDDGQYIFCAYSVLKQNDIVNGYQAYDLYYSFSQTSTLNFYGNGPIQITSGTEDERYVSLNRRAFTQGNNTYKLPFVYQKDPQPGSAAFIDMAPISRASLIYREITQAQIITNQKTEESHFQKNFALSQNYPNPFNPSTKIKFDIPQSGDVKLVVYDVLGRVVATLINEMLKPGTYEVEWNAGNYASGIYFYTLSTESFNQTRRMVLLK